MVKNYRYDTKDDKFIVIEQQTNQTISEVLTKEEARGLVKRLMGGQGFNGWTPSFFLIPIKNNSAFVKKEKKNESSDSGKPHDQ